MRILLDQDVPEPVLEPLRHLLRGNHDVDHINQIGWQGKKDRFVLPDARARGYDVLVTNDSKQLDDPDETDAIKRSGLHHVRYTQRHRGLEGLGLAMAAILAAMPGVVEVLEASATQLLVHIAAISPRDRFTATDPLLDPPRYWR